ncbi:MAG TPA: methyltransferase, partial [Armatimonadetes bacterium]|nr:methyltransferase [Armatimonadota bacterium]
MRSTGIMAIAYHRFKQYLGIEGGVTLVYDIIQQLALPEDAILDIFGVDVIDLGRAYLLSSDVWKDWELPDGTPCVIPKWFEPIYEGGRWVFKHPDGTIIAEMRPGVLYFEQACFPLADAHESAFDDLPRAMQYVMWAGLPCPPWHQLSTDEDYAQLREVARKLYEETDYAIMVAYGGNLLEWGQFLCGIENFLAELASNRRRAEALLDKLVELHLDGLGKFLDAVGDYVQIIQFGDDLGTQLGPQISPQMYREIFKPRHTAIFQAVKRHCNAAIFLHSCGGIYELIPDLIEAGVEILNPVQTSAVNMEPKRLKEEFGNDITFWGGGCDTQTILPFASPAEVKRHVRERIETFAPGGGFVFAQVHNIQADVPPENISAMVEIGRA